MTASELLNPTTQMQENQTPIYHSLTTPNWLKPLTSITEKFIADMSPTFQDIAFKGIISLENVVSIAVNFQNNALKEWNTARNQAQLLPCSLKQDDNIDQIVAKIRLLLIKLFPNQKNIFSNLRSNGLPIATLTSILAPYPILADCINDLFSQSSSVINNKQLTIITTTLMMLCFSKISRGEDWSISLVDRDESGEPVAKHWVGTVDELEKARKQAHNRYPDAPGEAMTDFLDETLK
jgi:hypothetical protein